MNAEELEVVPGFEHENLQGRVWHPGSDDELREGLEKAFDYRGDVTITRKDGRTVEGYIFDRRVGATPGPVGHPAIPQRRFHQGFDSLLRYREPGVYRQGYGSRQELGSLVEKILGKESRRRKKHRTHPRKARLALLCHTIPEEPVGQIVNLRPIANRPLVTSKPEQRRLRTAACETIPPHTRVSWATSPTPRSTRPRLPSNQFPPATAPAHTRPAALPAESESLSA